MACEENNIKILKGCHNQKKIKRTSLLGEVKIYNSITEAAEDCFNSKTPQNIESRRKTISKALKYNRKSYDYIWEYI
jgi:hypothetical protein